MDETIITADPVHDSIIGIFAEELELAPSDMTLTGHFVDDYDGDSLALIAVMARIEKELGIAIPRTELVNMTDLKSVFEIVDTLRERGGDGG